MSVADELNKLEELRRSGAINDDEYGRAKDRVLNAPPPPLSATQTWTPVPMDVESETRQWALYLHLSILTGYVVPLAGWVVPIVIWQIKKDRLPGLDIHGKNAVNWIISHLIYAIVCGLLFLVAVGIPLMVALGICAIIFPVVAAIKANNGEVWKYPLAIRFFS